MSKGLSDLQATLQSYQSSGDAIAQYVRNQDTDFFDDWKAKADAAKEKLEGARKLGDEIGEGYLGAKATHYAYKQFVNKYFNKKNQSDGDEDGRGDGDQGGDEAEGDGGGGQDTGGEPDGDPQGGDGADDLPDDAGGDADVGAGGDAGGADVDTSNQPLQTADDGDAVDGSFADQQGLDAGDIADNPFSFRNFLRGQGDAGDAAAAEAPPPTGTATIRTAQPEDLPSQAPDADPFQPGAGRSLGSEFVRADPAEGAAGDAGAAADAGDVAAGGADAAGAATGAASDAAAAAAGGAADAAAAGGAAIAGGTEAAAGVGSAVLGGLGVAAEALGPLGILAGIGIGLYELFHKEKPKPAPPVITTASTKGEMVLPTFDSVTDTPASMGAF